MHRYLFLLSTLVAVTLAAACRPSPAKTSATPASGASVSADTWAVVDGRPITRDVVEKAYRRMEGNTAASPSDEEALTAKLSLLNELIVQDILLARAPQLKVTVPDSEIDAAYAEAKKNISDEAFQKELSRRQLTPAELREALGRELLAEKVIRQEVGSKIVVTDQEVTDFYNANRDQFNVAEEGYHIAQIVVTPVRDPQLANRTGDDAGTPQAAATKAQMLMERLKTGAPFGDVAMDYSEDPESAPRGGDLGLVPLSRLKQAPPQLRDAVLMGTPGSARLVSGGGAYTIVLVVSHEPAGQRDLSTPGVRERISESIRARREQLLRGAYLTAARSDAKVVNYLARRIVESQGKKL
jgi:peptidyl-prolyl cis-trans isomerase SurA